MEVEVSENLTETENIFFELLNEDKLFNGKKLKKALIQLKETRYSKALEIREKKKKEQEKEKQRNKEVNMMNSRVSPNKSPSKSNFFHTPAQESNHATPITNNPNPNDKSMDAGGLNKSLQIEEKKGGKDAAKKHEDAKKNKKQKAKNPVIIDKFGECKLSNKPLPGQTFFQDLNYGDAVLVFKNCYYDFMLKEREQYELEQLKMTYLKMDKQASKVSKTPEEQRKREKEEADKKEEITKRYKEMSMKEAHQNTRIDLLDAYNFYSQNFFVKSENQIEKEETEKHQKRAFVNALIYFSDRYYLNNMKYTPTDKQPYNDLSNHSLKDFVTDSLFEFNLIHRISKASCYQPTSKDIKDNNSLIPAEVIPRKNRTGATLAEELSGKGKRSFTIPEVVDETDNYRFIKRYYDGQESSDWPMKQFQTYKKLTEDLNDSILKYYNDKTGHENTQEHGQDDPSQEVVKHEKHGEGLKIETLSEEIMIKTKDALDKTDIEHIILDDMQRRNKKNDIDGYFSDSLIILNREEKHSHSRKGKAERGVKYVPQVLSLKKKEINADILFDFEETHKEVLKGYTIDERIFHNLLRRMLIIKLNKNKIWSRQFYSHDMKLIYIVLKPLDSVIYKRAQLEGFNKQMELGFLDIQSLEPVDHRYRPYRKKDKNFYEIAITRIGTDKTAENVDDEKGASITPSSCDTEMVAKTIYTLKKKHDVVLEAYLKTQERQIDLMYKEMAQISLMKCLTNTNLNAKIDQDEVVHREEMEAYYIFSSILKYWHRMFLKMIKTKQREEKQIYEKYAGLIYRLIYQKALGSTNLGFNFVNRSFFKKIFCCRCKKRRYVKSLWDKLDVKPMSPYSKFDSNIEIWRTSEINERNDRAVFNSMERIKLLNNILQDRFNFLNMTYENIMEGFVPLHDTYLLSGKSKIDLFEKFDSVANFSHKADIEEKIGQINGMLNGLKDMSDPSDFIGQPLVKSLKCFFYSPTKLNVEIIQNYFGEKIALYFEFLTFHTKSLFWIGLIGILIFILDMIYVYQDFSDDPSSGMFDANNITSKDYYLILFKLNRFIMIIFGSIWTSLYIESWKRRQSLFAIKYGMTDFENQESNRPSFTGTYRRHLATSAFNVLYYKASKRLLTTIFTYFAIFCILLISVAGSFATLALKHSIAGKNSSDGLTRTNSSQFMVYFIPALFNYSIITGVSMLFRRVAMYFNNKENYRTLTQYEDKLIMKTFIFNFFNLFNSFFIIGFVKVMYVESTINNEDKIVNSVSMDQYATEAEKTFLLKKVASSYTLPDGMMACINVSNTYAYATPCYQELYGQVWSFFIIIFVFNFFEIAYPIYATWLRRKSMKSERKYEWGKVDEQIETDLNKELYQVTPEVDGVLYEYAELLNQYTFLSFFSMIFPLSFIISYFTSLCEIHIDKIVLLKYTRRPIPRSAADIGKWQYFLEVIAYAANFVNAAIFIYILEGVGEFNFIIFKKDRTRNVDVDTMKLKYFVFLLFILLTIKIIFSIVIGSTPDNMKQIMQRHQHIISRTIKSTTEASNFGKAGLPIKPSPILLNKLMKGGKANTDNDLNQKSKSVKGSIHNVSQKPVSTISVKDKISYKKENYNFD